MKTSLGKSPGAFKRDGCRSLQDKRNESLNMENVHLKLRSHDFFIVGFPEHHYRKLEYNRVSERFFSVNEV